MCAHYRHTRTRDPSQPRLLCPGLRREQQPRPVGHRRLLIVGCSPDAGLESSLAGLVGGVLVRVQILQVVTHLVAHNGLPLLCALLGSANVIEEISTDLVPVDVHQLAAVSLIIGGRLATGPCKERAPSSRPKDQCGLV